MTDAELAKKVVSGRAAAKSAAPLQGAVEKSMSAISEIGSATKLNLEAAVASATAASNGVQALGGQAISFSKLLFERQVEVAQAFAGVRSIQQLIELQTTYARSTAEAYKAEAAKATETLKSLADEAIKPLSARVSATLGRLQPAE